MSKGLSDNLLTLACWMSGEFSNYQQAQARPRDYAHIHIFFRPLAFDFFQGIGLYSEQVFDYDLWQPYRQGVHRLIDQGDHIYIENYALKNALIYAGSGRELSLLKTIRPDCIERRLHCSMVFRRQGERYWGCVEPGNRCLIEKNGIQTYLDSSVEVTETTWISLDKGMDIHTHQQVWGSTEGHLRFEKKESYAHEILISHG